MKTVEIQGKIKLWVEAISSAKLVGLADELEEILGSEKTIEEEKINKAIFKLLLYLSHTASRCGKSDRSTAQEIWRIGSWICRKMTKIPDGKKYFSGVYHVTSCLLETGMYREGVKMCNFLRAIDGLPKDESSNWEDMYQNVAHRLHSACGTLLKRLDLSNSGDWKMLLMTIKCEFDMTRLAHGNRWRYILSKILSYWNKICVIFDKSPVDCRNYETEFANFMHDYMKHKDIISGDKKDPENNEHVYKLMFSIVNEIILRNLTKRRFESMDFDVTCFYIIFSKRFDDHKPYRDCLNLYERLSTTLVKSIKTLAPSDVQGVDSCSVKLKKFFRSYGQSDAIKWYSYAVVSLLNELLVYWEEFAKSIGSISVPYLTDDLIISVMNYVDEQSTIFVSYEMTDCRCDVVKSQCKIRYDIYNNVALRLKTLSVVSRLLNGAKNRVVKPAMCNAALEFGITCLGGISELKDAGCKHWSLLWSVCGAHIYNIAVFCESKHHEVSVQLYSSMIQHLVKLEGLRKALKGPTLLKLANPLLSLLHRLTSTHYNNKKYEEAMIACSLNALLGVEKPMSEQTKVYGSWTNIKNKQPSDLTIIQCLRANKHEIDKIIDNLRFEDYNTGELCFREMISLANNGLVDVSSSIIALLDQLEESKAPAEIYSQGVQALGYHLLNLQSSTANPNILKYLQKATLDYEKESLPSDTFRLSYGHIKFYEFHQRLVELAETTEKEMSSVQSAFDSRPTTTSQSTSLSDPANIVPRYSTVDKKVTMEIAELLERALNAWKRVVNFLAESTQGNWQLSQTLEMAMVAGEYARLHHLENLEIEAWRLARKFAKLSDDNRSIIYTTTRSLTSQYIDEEWIKEADESLVILRDSTDPTVQKTIAGYLLTLADLYYENGERESADGFFNLATTKFGASFMADPTNFLLVLHLRMNQLEVEATDENYQDAYSRIIVEGLYTMLSIDDTADTTVPGSKLKRLYSNDVLFEFTCNLAQRMNSLLGHREISAHLMRRLGSANKSGAALRVAHCLKSLCYIDLTRAKLDDCEVKLQALEHILEIEAIDLTMETEQRIPPLCSTSPSENFDSGSSARVIEAVRDLGQSDTSPVLRNKIFKSPDFVLHDETCLCIKCSSSCYRSLVFAATHLRAQLFSLRRNKAASQQHFEGALTIKKNILLRASKVEGLRAYRHLDAVEFVIFHLDYCRFLKWSMPRHLNYALDIAQDALDLCESYSLQNHPVYVSTNMLIFELRYDAVYNDASLFKKFTVPAMEDIDISQYIQKPTFNPTSCVTPAREILPQQKAISVRRRKTPPFRKLEKVTIDLTEEDEPAINTSPPARTRPLRRCRTILDVPQISIASELKSKPKKSIVPIIEITSDSEDTEEKEEERTVSKDSNVSGEKTKHIEKSSEKISQRRGSSRSNKNSRETAGNSSANVPTVNIYEVTDLLGKMSVKKSTNRKLNNVKVVAEEETDAGQPLEDKRQRTSSRLRKKSQEVSSINEEIQPSKSKQRSVSKSKDDG